MKMRIRSSEALLAMLLFVAMFGAGVGQPAGTGWPAAIAPLAAERKFAEQCVALLKNYGNDAQIANGQFAYAKAKADDDAVISGLITALSTGATPASLPELQVRVDLSSKALDDFCNSVKGILPVPAAGTRDRDIWTALLTVVPDVLKKIPEGIAALYHDHRSDDALTRATIRTQLEAAKWRDFEQIEPFR
jgi:hypothetical protein